MTLLHFAVRNGYTEIVEMLLDSGANIDAECKDGTTPLHEAFELKKIEIVELLLNRGADVNAKGKYGKTYLHIAAEAGYLSIVELLLKRGADVNSVCTYDGKELCSPLYLAVINEHETVVQLLLEHGANVDAQDQYGKTILHFAVEKGRSLIIEHLLKHSPDVNNTSNRSAFNVAVHGCGKEYSKIAENLLQYGFTVNLEYGDNCKLLHGAVKKGYLKIVEQLVKYGVSIDSKDKDGSTALHIASKWSNPEVVKVLLEFGADIDSKDKYGSTALHIASQCRNTGIVEVLLKFGANINTVNTANLYVKNRNLLISSDDEELSDFRNEGEKKVATVKSEKTGNIWLYNNMIKRINQLPIYTGKKSTGQIFGSDYHKIQFPICTTVINNNSKQEERRKVWLEQGKKIFHSLFTSYLGIPRDCTEKIFNYLSDKDLKSVMDACKPITLNPLTVCPFWATRHVPNILAYARHGQSGIKKIKK